MTEKEKISVGKGKISTSLHINLFKASECLTHDLIITKLNDYGFSFSAVSLVESYMYNTK